MKEKKTDIAKTSETHIFLGGHDLEMEEISKLIKEKCPEIVLHDNGLSWGAVASEYQEEITRQLNANKRVILIELENDLNVPLAPAPDLWTPGTAIEIDHHRTKSGLEKPSSLQQMAELLNICIEQFEPARQRWLKLVMANDVGHVLAMKACDPPAEMSEMQKIRTADRVAQGVQPEDEAEAERAVSEASKLLKGYLTVVETRTCKTSPISDRLDADLGGAGYQILLISTPDSQNVYGPGDLIKHLVDEFQSIPSWWGGALPQQGFWGSNELAQADLISCIEHWVDSNNSN